MRRIGRLLVLGTLTAACAGVVMPAHAGEGELSLRGARQTSGPFKSTINVKVAANETKTFYLKAKNRTTNETMTPVLEQASAATPDYTFKYFKGTKDITAAVQADGKPVTLAPKQKKLFRVKVKAGAGSLDPYCLGVQLHEVPVGAGSEAWIGMNRPGCP